MKPHNMSDIIDAPEVAEGVDFSLSTTHETIQCISGRTCLIIKLRMKEWSAPDSHLWEPEEAPEIAELNEEFSGVLQQVMSKHSLKQHVLEAVTGGQHATLMSMYKGKKRSKRALWTGITMYSFKDGSPTRVALLAVDLQWEPPFSLSELRAYIYISRFIHLKAGISDGWLLADRDQVAPLRDILGQLLRSADALPLVEPARHHTVVSLGALPEGAVAALPDLLHDIALQQGSEKRSRSSDSVHTAHFLENRVAVGCGRGVVCLQFAPVSRGFEVRAFQAYRTLSLFLMGKMRVLDQLKSSALVFSESDTVQDISVLRDALSMVSATFALFKLQAAYGEIGGRLEYQQFHDCMKDALGLDRQLLMLHADVQDALNVSQSMWDSQRRRKKLADSMFSQRLAQLKAELAEAEASRSERFSLTVSIISAFLLPLVVSSGLWGMNNTDVPANVAWGGVVGVTLALGSAGLVAIAVFFKASSNKMRALRQAVADHQNTKSVAGGNVVIE